jgi:hypothetical protein
MGNNEFMKSDAALDRDINEATTPDEIRELLHAAVQRSGIADRDPQTGQFVRRDPLTPAAQVGKEAQTVTRTEVIGGKTFTFTGNALEVEQQVGQAYKIAEAVRPAAEFQVTPRGARKTQADAELDVVRKAELELAFKRGELDTATYLRESGALAEALQQAGFDLEAAARQQLASGWEDAVARWLQSDAGRDWPGNEQNLRVIGLEIEALGLVDAEDKLAALTQAWAAMKKAGTVFSTAPTEEQLLRETDGMTPQQILEAFKEAHAGDPDAANQGFISTFRGGRIGGSGIFGR